MSFKNVKLFLSLRNNAEIALSWNSLFPGVSFFSTLSFMRQSMSTRRLNFPFGVYSFGKIQSLSVRQTCSSSGEPWYKFSCFISMYLFDFIWLFSLESRKNWTEIIWCWISKCVVYNLFVFVAPLLHLPEYTLRHRKTTLYTFQDYGCFSWFSVTKR